MTGDNSDMAARLRSVLPSSWFPDDAPVLGGILSGFAVGWAWVYALLQAARSQTRLLSASGAWLDLIAADFFGMSLSRRAMEPDDAFRSRIQGELFREKATRPALIGALMELTGYAPAVFEPRRPADTGAYGEPGSGYYYGLAYGSAGGWGSLDLPLQCFVRAHRPTNAGIANVAGWAMPAGGYGIGAIEYATPGMIVGQVTDAEISRVVASTMPVATIAWLSITSSV